MRGSRYLFWFGMLVLLLSACASAPAVTSAPASAPAPAQPTQTSPTPIPNSSPSPTPTPSPTPEPTATPTPSATATPSPTPTPTPEATRVPQPELVIPRGFLYYMNEQDELVGPISPENLTVAWDDTLGYWVAKTPEGRPVALYLTPGGEDGAGRWWQLSDTADTEVFDFMVLNGLDPWEKVRERYNDKLEGLQPTMATNIVDQGEWKVLGEGAKQYLVSV